MILDRLRNLNFSKAYWVLIILGLIAFVFFVMAIVYTNLSPDVPAEFEPEPIEESL